MTAPVCRFCARPVGNPPGECRVLASELPASLVRVTCKPAAPPASSAGEGGTTPRLVRRAQQTVAPDGSGESTSPGFKPVGGSSVRPALFGDTNRSPASSAVEPECRHRRVIEWIYNGVVGDRTCADCGSPAIAREAAKVPGPAGAGEPRPFTASEALAECAALDYNGESPRVSATLRAYAEATSEEAVDAALDVFLDPSWRNRAAAFVSRHDMRAAIRAALKVEGE